MSIAGTVGGFVILYLAPILIHFKTLSRKKVVDSSDGGLLDSECVGIPEFYANWKKPNVCL